MRGHRRIRDDDPPPPKTKVSEEKKGPTIIFPTLMHKEINVSGLLEPMLMVTYPLIYDYDEMKPTFTVWEERISGQF